MINAIEEAISIAHRAANEWRNLYFPRKLGNLIEASGVTIFFRIGQRNFDIEFRSGNTLVDYASFVNEFVGVQWTNPQTVTHYFEEWKSFAMQVLQAALNYELDRFFTTSVIMFPTNV